MILIYSSDFLAVQYDTQSQQSAVSSQQSAVSSQQSAVVDYYAFYVCCVCLCVHAKR